MNRETELVGAILQHLRFRGVLAWRANTGAVTARSENGRSRFVRFGIKGMADILGVVTSRCPACRMLDIGATCGWCSGGVVGRFLAIEVKGPQGRLAPEQAAFLDWVRMAGGISIVAWCVADVDAMLARCGAIPAPRAPVAPRIVDGLGQDQRP